MNTEFQKAEIRKALNSVKRKERKRGMIIYADVDETCNGAAVNHFNLQGK